MTEAGAPTENAKGASRHRDDESVPEMVVYASAVLITLGLWNAMLAFLITGLLAQVTLLAGVLFTLPFWALSAVFLALSLGYFVVAWGLTDSRRWAWIWAVLLALGGLGNAPVGTGLGVIGLVLLSRPQVREHFR